MSRPHIMEIPYRPSEGYFLALHDRDWPVWLDSGESSDHRGRYDILAASPCTTITSNGSNVEITHNGEITSTTGCPFETLESWLPNKNQPTTQGLPFCGGAIGYFSYDLARQCEKLPDTADADISLPEMQIGIYQWAIIQDHQLQKSYLVSLPEFPSDQLQAIATEISTTENKNISFSIKGLESNFNSESYHDCFTKIQNYIHAGDCYQVNLAQRFSGEYSGSPLAAYLKLRKKLPSPFSAYFEPAQGAILSLSPERFIESRLGKVKTQPIKGTIARGATPEADQLQANKLQESIKDRAENLMIVDLLRNDLSKNCAEGSVKTTKLFDLESYANVHHLVSTITGQLKNSSSPVTLLKQSFPGGSITGAPKIRAMEIIEELEPCRRSIYCGSIGYISADGQMDTSIAIRTLVCDDNIMHCWGGGGIVSDSNADMEYEESLAKIGVILKTLESM
jgi:para-aminobenzoate synthetase component I